MERILYIDGSSGISGDMTVGALLDLGADREYLEKVLSGLPLEGYKLHFGRTKKCGLDAYNFDVELCGHHEHEHTHRGIRQIHQIIQSMEVPETVRKCAEKIFYILGQAEAKAHGIPLEEVHFHEVGAVDSIIDIVSTAVCLENLGIRQVVVSPLREGCGSVECCHGVIPVPVPATVNIASEYGLVLRPSMQEGEMVTPTGAAIAAALKTRDRLPETCRIIKTGIGAGNKDFKQANVLRMMIMEAQEDEEDDRIWVMESNIDDASGEMLGFAMERLMEQGALDVWYTPVFMKKNRPAYKLSVLCRKTDLEKLRACVFKNTTTIGIRRYPVERDVLSRTYRQVETAYGPAGVKVCEGYGSVHYYPEYESAAKICRKENLEYTKVYEEIKKAASEER